MSPPYELTGHLNLAAAASGTLALACVLIWPMMRGQRGVLWVQSLGAAAFGLHFALLGAPTAAAVSLISLGQLLVAAMVRDRQLVRAFYAISLFALVVFAVATWHGVISLLAVGGSLAGTLARSQRRTSHMKLFFVLGAPFWIVHNVVVGAPFALLVDVISVVSNGSSLFRIIKRQLAESGVGAILSSVFCLPPAILAMDQHARGTVRLSRA